MFKNILFIVQKNLKKLGEVGLAQARIFRLHRDPIKGPVLAFKDRGHF
jgi:hypothetical protein